MDTIRLTDGKTDGQIEGTKYYDLSPHGRKTNHLAGLRFFQGSASVPVWFSADVLDGQCFKILALLGLPYSCC